MLPKSGAGGSSTHALRTFFGDTLVFANRTTHPKSNTTFKVVSQYQEGGRASQNVGYDRPFDPRSTENILSVSTVE